MSGNRTKKLRAIFEERHGFTSIDRGQSIYKRYWRRFKKDNKNNKGEI